MQSSIKDFFKSKQEPNKRTEGEKKVVDSVKRPVESDDDEDKVVNKRQAVSSSPFKVSNKSSGKKVLEDSNFIVSSTTVTSTTPKKVTPKPGESKMTSPLIGISVVIRKKISNGAYALHDNMGDSWFRALQGEFDKPYFKKLSNFVHQERQSKTVFPPENKVYSWTHYHDIKDTRVIVLGQDPYHAPGQAHGLSFSVQKGIRIPPSLINIYKELESDIPGFKSPPSGDLTGWAKQGVLMLNTCLTVNQGQANSHQNKGWETFTDAVITWISKNVRHKVVFMLWGRPAQRKSGMIDKRHKVLTAAHPSPLSAHNGFFGCAHFSQTNSFLRSQSLPEIDWKALY